MLSHLHYHYVILKKAVAMIRGGEEIIGWETNRGVLGNLLADAGLEGQGRALDDALLLMRDRKQIVVHKVICVPGRWDFNVKELSEFHSVSEFFSGPFQHSRDA